MTDTIRFGRAELRLAQRQLLVDGQPAALGARAFDVLALLVAQRHRVVGKDELLAAAWPGVVVEENDLQVQISALRQLLGAGAITTVAGQGYRFTAPIAEPPAAYGATASGVGTFAQHPSPAPMEVARLSVAALSSGQAPAAEVRRSESAGRNHVGAPTAGAGPPSDAPPAAPDSAAPPLQPEAYNRWMTWVIWLLALAAIAYSAWMFTRDRPAPAGQPAEGHAGARAEAPAGASVAVLPFVDLSEKRDQEYFSDGLSESLIDRLARMPGLRVPARASCFYFKGRSEDVTDIARKLRVSHVPGGSARKSGSTTPGCRR